MINILVVENERTVSDVIVRYLRREGYQVDAANDGIEGLRMALTHQPDLIVLDLVLPGLDGLEVCRHLRAIRQTPVVMLTAKAEDGDVILGLGLGADDYVRKPFSPPELVARVKAVLHKDHSPIDTAILVYGEMRIDAGARTVCRGDQTIDVRAKEFDLLWHLASHPGQAFTREQLLSSVWDYDYLGNTSTVTVW